MTDRHRFCDINLNYMFMYLSVINSCVGDLYPSDKTLSLLLISRSRAKKDTAVGVKLPKN